jgi:UDP-N-acetylmuramoyl-L-alanyl-D-glutamate--2,6-diaminopimelate ligase
MEDYFAAKCALFSGQQAPPPRWAVLNADDEWARRIPLAAETSTIWYGLGTRAALRAENIEAGFAGLRFDLSWDGNLVPVASPLVGRMNVYNILAACGAGLSHKLPLEAAAAGVAACRSFGRFERRSMRDNRSWWWSITRTPTTLRNAIAAARG